MPKEIFDLIKDFQKWEGNTYTLAALIVEKLTEINREKLIAAGYADAAEVI